MSMIKRGTSEVPIIVSSSVYLCHRCGHTEIARDVNDTTKECPKCKSSMELVSSTTSTEMPKE